MFMNLMVSTTSFGFFSLASKLLVLRLEWFFHPSVFLPSYNRKLLLNSNRKMLTLTMCLVLSIHPIKIKTQISAIPFISCVTLSRSWLGKQSLLKCKICKVLSIFRVARGLNEYCRWQRFMYFRGIHQY